VAERPIGVDAGAIASPASSLDILAARIREGDAVVAVVGLGYVGLPLLVAIHAAGMEVIGFDTEPDKIASLRDGRSYVVDVPDSEVVSLRRAAFSTDPAALARADVVAICVPTPLTDHTPDLTMVREAATAVAEHLAPGRLIILESTTYPGTTEEEVAPILEKAGVGIGRDVALAYSPERIDPGQSTHRLDNTPKIVAGVTDRCRELAASFYARICRELVLTSSPREAEMAKLVENTFRQVNIALVNELAILARELGVDIWEALSAAATKPFGYMAFWPGPGVGGHCISIDPSYLSWRAGQQLGYRAGFIEHANEVNNRMPDYVISRLGEALNDAGKPIRGSRILAVGVAYKGGVDDRRGSPALAVIRRLQAKGAQIAYHDPFVGQLQVGEQSLSSLPLDDTTVRDQDCVLILTAHPGIDVRALVAAARLVFDTRGLTSGLDAPNVTRL
jgi:UDP-N-acetyl-D-glucosamine dehydrogenase